MTKDTTKCHLKSLTIPNLGKRGVSHFGQQEDTTAGALVLRLVSLEVIRLFQEKKTLQGFMIPTF